jgi:hypothetical protein
VRHGGRIRRGLGLHPCRHPHRQRVAPAGLQTTGVGERGRGGTTPASEAVEVWPRRVRCKELEGGSSGLEARGLEAVLASSRQGFVGRRWQERIWRRRCSPTAYCAVLLAAAAPPHMAAVDYSHKMLRPVLKKSYVLNRWQLP